MTDLEALRRHLTAPLRGRRVLLGVGPLAAYRSLARNLREDGALRPFVVASSTGTGEPPTDDEAGRVLVDLPRTRTLSETIRAELALLDDPPLHVAAAVDAYDPDRSAVWLGQGFLERDSVLGRPVLGRRPRAWAALEDKSRCDALFDAAGVVRAPSQTVPVDGYALRQAAARLDGGSGTVWSGDSAAGVNGGGEYVCWVRTDEDEAAALRRLSVDCEQVRVAPFLEGVPCSIHGVVLPDGVAVGRPVELVNLRARGSSFAYAGLSTWWDPPDGDRDSMREAARSVGRHLAERHGYAGAFGLDGVLTADGWRPTELNARASVGLHLLTDAVEGLPFGHLQRALVSGYPPGVGADELQLLLDAAGEVRAGRPRAFSTSGEVHETQQVAVTGGPGDLRAAGPGDEVTGTLERGPAPIGSLVALTVADGLLRPGDRVAPWAVAALALADALWDTGFGATWAPPDVRTGGPVP